MRNLPKPLLWNGCCRPYDKKYSKQVHHMEDWDAPYLHAQSIGIVAAYDMYKECCDGLLDATWKVDEKDRMSYSEFCKKLSKQMLEYDPKNNLYNGDVNKDLSPKITRLDGVLTMTWNLVNKWKHCILRMG